MNNAQFILSWTQRGQPAWPIHGPICNTTHDGGGEQPPPETPPTVYDDLLTLVGNTVFVQLEHAAPEFWTAIDETGSNLGIYLPGVLGQLGAKVNHTLLAFDKATQCGQASVDWTIPLIANYLNLIVQAD